MVPPTSCRVSRVPQYSGYYSLQFRFRIQGFHFLWPGFPACSSILLLTVSFSSSGYLDVSVPRVPLYKLCIYLYISMVFMDGFPHSDISGSQNICFSPPLFAAYHVLLRLPVPRHPPCALFCLTISTYSVMSDGLFNLSIALVCFCYSL